MKKGPALLLILALLALSVHAKDTAKERAERMGPGMNLSFLENFWNGTKEKHFADFVNREEFEAAKQRLIDIRRAGFTTVRLPVNFSAWASMEPPYDWESEDLPRHADQLVEWALEAGLTVIIDHHHPELDESFPVAVSTVRMVALWTRIAERYRDRDPERVIFELRNEPKNIESEVWRAQAEALIKVVRKVAPEHTLIVGYHDWNSRDAMIASRPFDDSNLIYTFHYYHPFMFTHKGATWVAPGISDLRNIPFPGEPGTKLAAPEKAKGTWVEQQLRSYGEDANAAVIDSHMKEARAWADKHKVPIFLGEFGSLSTFSNYEDRCRHAEAVYAAIGKYRIPSAWWEWFAGFNFLDKEGRKPVPCFAEALKKYSAALDMAD
ncbi:MAG TPA: glycoside hydrolase family 5 protein [Aridibacter sp.]|nr:glycoside hydrolase family 5 protein [Aridibacter sp.]